jgi:uncharacterized membrane protein
MTKKIILYLTSTILLILTIELIFIHTIKSLFYGLFGFLSCLLVILVSKTAGELLKRDKDYYS